MRQQLLQRRVLLKGVMLSKEEYEEALKDIDDIEAGIALGAVQNDEK